MIRMYTLFGDDNKVLEVSSSEVKWVLLSGVRIIEYLSEDEYEEIK